MAQVLPESAEMLITDGKPVGAVGCAVAGLVVLEPVTLVGSPQHSAFPLTTAQVWSGPTPTEETPEAKICLGSFTATPTPAWYTSIVAFAVDDVYPPQQCNEVSEAMAH